MVDIIDDDYEHPRGNALVKVFGDARLDVADYLLPLLAGKGVAELGEIILKERVGILVDMIDFAA